MTYILAGDIGGTKTRLAMVTVAHGRVQIERVASFPSRSYLSLEDMLTQFLRGEAEPKHAAFGIAGPVQGKVVRVTNLPWVIDADVLLKRFGFLSCSLLNDLEATALGLPALYAGDVLTLQMGTEGACGNRAVIAAGTGLGEAGLYWDGQYHRPYATEGGHCSFCPQDEVEIELLRYLQRKHEHVSWERVVSGMGLLDLHEFLREYRHVPLPSWLDEEMRHDDAAAVISRAAATGRDELCVETLGRFVRLYGAEAGNLALKTMSRGGMFVGGGIAPKILPQLQSGSFVAAFLHKGRMRPLLEEMPLHIILNDHVALYGPALHAAQQAESAD